MTVEEEKTGLLSKILQWQYLVSASEIARGDCRRCSRLYLLPSAGRTGLLVTLSEFTQYGTVEILALRKAERDLPVEWDKFLGKRNVPRQEIARFLDQLQELGVWNLPDCETNVRDGLLCLHVVASEGKEHCFQMATPHLHPDPVYREIVNRYSDAFVGGTFSA